MASLSKFLKSPKSYTAKKFKSGIKTVKENPLTLAAQVLSTLSEVAQSHNDYQRGLPGAMSPWASLLRGGAQLTQGWQNAKAATKKHARAKNVEEIINMPGMKNDDGSPNPDGVKTMAKIEKLVGLGEHKTAADLMKLHGLKKAIKAKKKSHAEKVRINDFNIDHSNKTFEETKSNNAFNRQHSTDTFNWTKNKDLYNIEHGEQKEAKEDNRWGAEQSNKTERAIINAIGVMLKKGGTPDQLLNLIKNNSLVEGLKIKKGIPFATGQTIKINEPHYLPDGTTTGKSGALNRFLTAIRDK